MRFIMQQMLEEEVGVEEEEIIIYNKDGSRAA